MGQKRYPRKQNLTLEYHPRLNVEESKDQGVKLKYTYILFLQYDSFTYIQAGHPKETSVLSSLKIEIRVITVDT